MYKKYRRGVFQTGKYDWRCDIEYKSGDRIEYYEDTVEEQIN